MAHHLPTEHFTPRQLVSDAAERLTYEADAGFDRALPDGVFYPESTDDVRRIVLWAKARGVPLVARGAGTGLAGGAVAERGGIVVVASRMHRLLELDFEGRSAVVEAGAVNLDVETAVRDAGLYYPPDPSSGRTCCLGGNLGTNAGGPHCFKYGVTTHYVTGVEIVLADGRKVQIGGRALDVPEIDLVSLVVGGEGTLGFVTRADLRLLRQPPGVRTLMAAFTSLEEAGEAVSAVIAAGLVPATLEAIDQPGMRVIEGYCDSGLPVDAGAALIVEVDGHEASLDAQIREVAEVLESHGGFDLRLAADEEERQRIWYGRKSAAGAMSRLGPSYYLTDLTVKRSRLAAVLGEIHRICNQHDIETASFFHAGDGNLHPLIPYDPRDADWRDRAHRGIEEITALCVAEDGSISGEHGIGMEKRRYMPMMYSGAELSAMRDVKKAFDPEGLFNPGKVLPDQLPAVELATPTLPVGDVSSPASGEEAAGVLRALSDAGLSVRIGSGAAARRGDGEVAVSTAALGGILDLAPEDLYVTVGAGCAMSELASRLAEHGLVAPPAPFPEMSVGALMAQNLNAPQRMRYGSLSDVTLGVRVALADGRLLRLGRPLVKNVAGYDLPKVFVGAHGTLGLVTEVTWKLSAAPRLRRTLSIRVSDRAAGLELCRASLPLALVASALVLVELPGETPVLFYTAEGMPEEVDAELTEVKALWKPIGDVSESSASGTDAWAGFLNATPKDHLLVRLGAPVKDLADVGTCFPSYGGSRWLVDYASGMAYGSLPCNDQAGSQLQELRTTAASLGGYVVVLAAPDGLELDRWGYEPEALDVMQRLRARFDPAGILEPGTFLF